MVVRYRDILELITVLSDEKGLQVNTGWSIAITLFILRDLNHNYIVNTKIKNKCRKQIINYVYM